MGEAIITFWSEYDWAVVNSFWELMYFNRIKPTNVYFICPDNKASHRRKVISALERILQGYGFPTTIESVNVIEDDLKGVGSKVMEIAKKEKAAGSSVSMDVSPSRKGPIIAAVIAAVDHVDKVFYNFLKDVNIEGKKPFLNRPLNLNKFHELKEESVAWRKS